MIRSGLFLVLVLLMPCRTAAGQPDPFSELDAWAGLVLPGQQRALADYWDPGLGAAAGVATPFFTGRLTGSIRFVPYSALKDVPAFKALNLRAGWDGSLLAYGRTALRGSFHVGNLLMSFDDSGSEPGIRNESEFAAGYGAGLYVRIGPASGIALTATQERVFTRRPIDLRHWSLAYTRQFATPGWLRRWIE